jgi:hypothetical protein
MMGALAQRTEEKNVTPADARVQRFYDYLMPDQVRHDIGYVLLPE